MTDLDAEDPRSKAGLACRMILIQRSTMTGPSSHSWPCLMALTRMAACYPCSCTYSCAYSYPMLLKRYCPPLTQSLPRSTEDFSYFTLRRRASTSPSSHSTSAFGISCTRQLDAKELIDKPADVTRSTVQKAVVCIAESPKWFGQLREKLSMVTEAWFAQRYAGQSSRRRHMPERRGREWQD